MSETNKPVKVFRCGSVKASVWKNVRDEKEFYSVAIVRVYKNGEEWKETNSYDVRDLHALNVVSNKAFEYLKLKEE